MPLTPHIGAEAGEFASDVLMPGDPKRADRIAAELLTDAKLVTDVRGVTGYTGTLDGRPLSVMASGMGAPSMSIYATELFRFYGVRRIVRVGTCGGLQDSLEIGDVVVAAAAHTNSSVSQIQLPGVSLSLAASPRLLHAALSVRGDVKVGPVYSTDFFYLSRPDILPGLERIGTLAIEMEAAGLYACALNEGAEALTILTVSDHVKKPAAMTAAEREQQFAQALDLAVRTLAQ